MAATKIKYNSTLWQRYNCDTTPWSPPTTSKNDTQPRGSVLLYVLFFPQDFVICKPCDIVGIQLSLKSCNRKNVVLSNQWQLQVWLRSSIPRMWSHHCWLCHTHKKLSKPIVHREILRTNVSNNSANCWSSLTKHPHVSIIFLREEDAPSVGKYGKNNALEQPPQDRKHISWKIIVHFLCHRKASLTFLTNNFPYYPLPFI